jgi:hypothetical protein
MCTCLCAGASSWHAQHDTPRWLGSGDVHGKAIRGERASMEEGARMAVLGCRSP